MYGLIMQESSTDAIEKSCGPLKCLQRLLMIT